MGVLDKLSVSDLNALSDAEVEAIKADIWSKYNKDSHRVFADRGGTKIIAEGDSWFNYSFAGLDIIDFLADATDYSIIRHATPGDTLENMVYGTEFRSRSYSLIPPQFEDVLADIKKHQPKFFLFSGGGNDIAGPELEGLLNHKSSGRQPLRSDHLSFLVNDTFKSAYTEMIERIWNIDRKIHILTHGYAYAIPSGKGVGRILGYSFIGPWLRPAMTKKRIVDPVEQTEIVSFLIDAFNDMLAELSRQYDYFHVVDFREKFSKNDWVNELHLTNAAFKRAAESFNERIEMVLAGG